MPNLVNVSVLQPITLRLSNSEEHHYAPGIRTMPYEHAQRLGLLRRIRSEAQEEEVAQTSDLPPVDPIFVALDGLFDEKLVALLKGAGYNNLAELSRANRDELLAIKEIGPSRYEEIQSVLGRRMPEEKEGE